MAIKIEDRRPKVYVRDTGDPKRVVVKAVGPKGEPGESGGGSGSSRIVTAEDIIIPGITDAEALDSEFGWTTIAEFAGKLQGRVAPSFTCVTRSDQPDRTLGLRATATLGGTTKTEFTSFASLNSTVYYSLAMALIQGYGISYDTVGKPQSPHEVKVAPTANYAYDYWVNPIDDPDADIWLPDGYYSAICLFTNPSDPTQYKKTLPTSPVRINAPDSSLRSIFGAGFNYWSGLPTEMSGWDMKMYVAKDTGALDENYNSIMGEYVYVEPDINVMPDEDHSGGLPYPNPSYYYYSARSVVHAEDIIDPTFGPMLPPEVFKVDYFSLMIAAETDAHYKVEARVGGEDVVVARRVFTDGYGNNLL